MTTECFPTCSEFMRHKKTLSVLLVHILQRRKKSIPDSLRISREKARAGVTQQFQSSLDDFERHNATVTKIIVCDRTRTAKTSVGRAASGAIHCFQRHFTVSRFSPLERLSSSPNLIARAKNAVTRVWTHVQHTIFCARGPLRVLGTHCTARQTKMAAHT